MNEYQIHPDNEPCYLLPALMEKEERGTAPGDVPYPPFPIQEYADYFTFDPIVPHYYAFLDRNFRVEFSSNLKDKDNNFWCIYLSQISDPDHNISFVVSEEKLISDPDAVITRILDNYDEMKHEKEWKDQEVGYVLGSDEQGLTIRQFFVGCALANPNFGNDPDYLLYFVDGLIEALNKPYDPFKQDDWIPTKEEADRLDKLDKLVDKIQSGSYKEISQQIEELSYYVATLQTQLYNLQKTFKSSQCQCVNCTGEIKIDPDSLNTTP